MTALVLSNINMEPWREFLTWADARLAGFNQYLSVLSTPASSGPAADELILLHVDGEQLLRDVAEEDDAVEAHEFVQALESFCRNSPGTTVVVNTLAIAPLRSDTYAAALAPGGQVKALNATNQALRRLVETLRNLVLVDLSIIVQQFGWQQLTAPAFWYVGRIRYSNLMFRELSRHYRLALAASRHQAKKVLVVDLDNTLWSGVVGEEGALGVQLSEDGVGRCFRDLQRQIKALSRLGVLLAINSKNNQADVDELFARNPMMVLRREDFAAVRTNWSNKVENLQSIAEELNLGLDAFVFLDDSEVERQLVKEHLPQVSVPEWPRRPETLPAWFVDQVAYEYFPKYRISSEDRDKAGQYARNAQRREAQATVNGEAFIDRLGINVTYHIDRPELVERASQMTQKTNQFNMTTRRYSPGDIRRFVDSPVHGVVMLEYSDRFGQEGLTGLAILDLEHSEIDTFLLSCRVIGRGVEDGLLRTVETLAQQAERQALYADFVPTPKNAPARGFYERRGFVAIAQQTSGETRYVKELA